MEPGTLSIEDRKSQLIQWEKDRKHERSAVTFPVMYSFVTSFFLAIAIYSITVHWLNASLATVASIIAALIPLFYWLAAYLQTWGSYVERRLEDIEAKIDGRSPAYYIHEDYTSFRRQPLHERLDRIEEILSKRGLRWGGE